MGRIHRIGQEREVYAFNFVAERSSEGKPVIEGRILKRLLDKLEEMRQALGSDRVYDVIGQVLALNQVNLANMLREAALYPGRLGEYEDRIEQLSLERLRQYEEQTGIALARAYVDFPQAQEAAFLAEERRLMPEYIARQFLAMAEKVGLKVEPRADGLWRVPYVPQDLRSESLEAVRRFGKAESRYHKITFHKEHLEQDRHLDAVLISPGHPLYAAMDERFRRRYGDLLGACAAFVDGEAGQPYFLHFFESGIVGDYPRANTALYSELVCVRQQGDQLELVPADVLHDLAPLEQLQQQPNLDWRPAEACVRVRSQIPRRQETLQELQQQAGIIREYLQRSFGERLWAAQRRAMDLRCRHEEGEKEVVLALQEAEREVEDLERRQRERLEQLRFLEVVRPGPVRYLGGFFVVPAGQVIDLGALAEDLEAKARSERLAMQIVMDYERRRGWEPVDVSTEKMGFDIHSLSPADPMTGRRDIRRIEVKGRRGGEPVRLTENEWRKARQLRDTYWLYVVWDPHTSPPEPVRVQNPSEVLGPYAREVRQISHYEIPADAISNAAQRAHVQPDP